MKDVEQKYNINEIIVKIEEYLNEQNLDKINSNKIQQILFKLRNIDTIINNMDEDLLNGIIDNEYNNLIEYCDYLIDCNDSYISDIFSTTDSIINKLVYYVDFNMLFNNKSQISKYVKSYKNEIIRQSDIINNEINEISEFIKLKKDNIEQQDSELNNQINAFNSILEELKQNQENLKSDIDSFFEKTENNINDYVKKENDKIQNLYKDNEQKLNDKFSKLRDSSTSKFKKLSDDILKKDQEISNLIGIIGEKARIGEYKKNADSAHKERVVWQLTTIILFIISLILIIIIGYNANDNHKFMLFRYVVGAIILGATAYTAKQASNSRKDEVYYRKQELELASIDVYLSNMDKNNRETIKKELSTKMFGQAQRTYTNKYEEGKGININDLIKLIDICKKTNL